MLKASNQRKRKRFRKNREIILEAAKRVFSRKGFENTTMADIAQAAEMAAGTLYLYFRGKEELFYAVMEEGMNGLLQELKDAITGEKEANKQLRLFVQIPFHFFEENRDFYKIYLRELPSCSGEEARKSKRRCFQGHLDYVDILEGCLRKQVWSTGAIEYPYREAALMIKGAIDYMIFGSMFEETTQPLTEKVDFLVEVFQKGLAKAARKVRA